MGLLLLASIVWIVLGRRRGKESSGRGVYGGSGSSGKGPGRPFHLLGFSCCRAALYEARSFPYLGAIFPMAATIPAIFMAAIQLVVELRAPRMKAGIETRGKTKLALGYFAFAHFVFSTDLAFRVRHCDRPFHFLFSSTAGSKCAGSMP